jgi:N-carbamoylputrescine amidase
VRAAAGQGAHNDQIQALIETPFLCCDEMQEHFALAAPAEGNPLLARMAKLAAELQVVLPVSFFEQANNAYYNSVAIIDADGSTLGVYRKSHIPDGPGYQEKYYFNPGDSGFKVWPTRYGTLGCGICWDQWFPETARAMALMGAEILFYPTAIGNEPQDATISAKDHWQRTMQGHAAANMMPLVASNRIGKEDGEAAQLTFFGASFIADNLGAKVAEADGNSRAVITATFDLDRIRAERASWGLFRDRRPELYGALLTADGGRR